MRLLTFISVKRCLNCDNPVPSYFIKYCSVYCRKDIRKCAELSYRKHRKSYFERCRESPSGLHVHHLNGNPADNRPDNLITLCAHCHMLIHKHERQGKKRKKKTKKSSLGWMLDHYRVPGGKPLSKPKGILDHFMS